MFPDLLGSVKVESGVINLQEELALCGEAEEALREQQEEQASLQTPGDQVEPLDSCWLLCCTMTEPPHDLSL